MDENEVIDVFERPEYLSLGVNRVCVIDEPTHHEINLIRVNLSRESKSGKKFKTKIVGSKLYIKRII